MRKFTMSGWVQGQEDDPEYLGRTSISWESILDEGGTDHWENKWGWGGECRGEVYLDVTLGNDDVMTVKGQIKLYEGASEGTNDLDGSTEFTITLPAGKSLDKDVTVYNDDEDEPDTWFRVKVSFHNGPVAPEEEKEE